MEIFTIPLVFKNIDDAIFTECGYGYIITQLINPKPSDCPDCTYFENRNKEKYKIKYCDYHNKIFDKKASN